MQSKGQAVRLTITGVIQNHSQLELTSEYGYQGYFLLVEPKEVHIRSNSQGGKNDVVATANKRSPGGSCEIHAILE